MIKNTEYRKSGAIAMALLLLLESIFPTIQVMATGPTQPEPFTFSPVSANQLVDPFTGDFSYNIPLLDVGGYPLNLFYNAGITPEQEASWVGLGWNLNAGAITRNMRGLPDDFSGKEITKKMNMKEQVVVGSGGGLTGEFLGKSLGFEYTQGIFLDNYHGMGFETSGNINFNFANSIKGLKNSGWKLGAGLSISNSTAGPASMSPNISMGYKIWNTENHSSSLNFSVGTTVNSMKGHTDLNYGVSTSHEVNLSDKAKKDRSKAVQKRRDTRNKKRKEQGKKPKEGNPNSPFDEFSPSSIKGLSVSGNYSFVDNTVIPTINFPRKSSSTHFKYKAGVNFKPKSAGVIMYGYTTKNSLATNERSLPAYGYLYSDKTNGNEEVLHDFNREKDAPFLPELEYLPVTNYTYDIFSLSGQGLGGTFRAYRNDLPIVHDALTTSTGDGGSGKAEAFYGHGAQLGYLDVDLSTKSEAGKWDAGLNNVGYVSGSANSFYEPFYFKQMGEMVVDTDQDFFNKIGGAEAVRFKRNGLNVSGQFQKKNGSIVTPKNKRDKRFARSLVIQHITKQMANRLNYQIPGTESAQGPEIVQFNVTTTDGNHYIYGQPVYTREQNEMMFNIHGREILPNGQVKYKPEDATTLNKRGKDFFFQRTEVPAYVNSYLLTQVRSNDYSDLTGNGLTPDDLGTYVKFTYGEDGQPNLPSFRWRTPYEKNTGNFIEGKKASKVDNKAAVTEGTKDIWYTNKIETKTHYALFDVSDREDGLEPEGDTPSNHLKKLDRIRLYTQQGELVKTVHFKYTYDLAKGTPDNESGNGKLTLSEVYFTYGDSYAGMKSRYAFDYANNPNYQANAFDRWGHYLDYQVDETGLTVQEYPYTPQKETNKYKPDAWSLTKVSLPSGGSLEVTYEPDDYAYVQDKSAAIMSRIVGLSQATNTYIDKSGDLSMSSGDTYLWFEIDETTPIDEYFKGVDKLYYKSLINIRGSHNEYLSGYLNIKSKGAKVKDGTRYGYVEFELIDGQFNPFSVSCWNHVRQTDPRYYYDNSYSPDYFSLPAFDPWSRIKLMWDEGLLEALGDLSSNLYVSMFSKNIGKRFTPEKSWVRLNEPTGKKIGGGVRVRELKLTDNWDGMTDGEENVQSITTHYSYELEDGRSSGVASNEPMVGGDESALRDVSQYAENLKGVPDLLHYVDLPMGESFLPTPVVGYSRVKIKKEVPEGEQGEGHVVSEFYTAKEFPVLASNTEVSLGKYESAPDGKLKISSLFHQKIEIDEKITATQGYAFEVNDMHGKPKKNSVFSEAGRVISEEEFKYKEDDSFSSKNPTAKKLDNIVTTIDRKGIISKSQIGVEADFVADMRSYYDYSSTDGFDLNVIVFPIPVFPFFVPAPFPQDIYTRHETTLKMGVITKVVQRYGVLEEVVTNNYGSVVKSKSLAWDKVSGQVLVTETNNNYGDPFYSVAEPAHWHYDGMAQGYERQGATMSIYADENGEVSLPAPVTIPMPFRSGDMVALNNLEDEKEYWVASKIDFGGKTDELFLMDGNGDIVSMADLADFSSLATIIKPANINMGEVEVVSTVLLDNPLGEVGTTLKTLVPEYANKLHVINTSAIEYDEVWKTFCNCTQSEKLLVDQNPYTVGIFGNWRKKKTAVYTGTRFKSDPADDESSTNVRKDGYLDEYIPYWTISNSTWNKTTSDKWVISNMVTEYNTFGNVLETKNPLNIRSMSQYGQWMNGVKFNGANMRYYHGWYTGYETEYECTPLNFQHGIIKLSNDFSHTGEKSAKILPGKSIEYFYNYQ